jgi:hypothetical protein
VRGVIAAAIRAPRSGKPMCAARPDGVLLGVTPFRTFTDGAEHSARMLSLHATFGFD